MADLIRVIFDFFSLVVSCITNALEGVVSFFTSLSTIHQSIFYSAAFFPSYLYGIMFASVSILVFLRIIGR